MMGDGGYIFLDMDNLIDVGIDNFSNGVMYNLSDG